MNDQLFICHFELDDWCLSIPFGLPGPTSEDFRCRRSASSLLLLIGPISPEHPPVGYFAARDHWKGIECVVALAKRAWAA